jgi:hypothetical protein
MPRKPEGPRKKLITKGGLIRETIYLYADEELALEDRAVKAGASKSEIVRRALRAFLKLDA